MKSKGFNDLPKVTQLQGSYIENESGSNFAKCCTDLRGDAPMTRWESQSWPILGCVPHRLYSEFQNTPLVKFCHLT